MPKVAVNIDHRDRLEPLARLWPHAGRNTNYLKWWRVMHEVKPAPLPKVYRVLIIILQFYGFVVFPALLGSVVFGRPYRASVLAVDLKTDFEKHGIVAGCPLSTVSTYMKLRHAPLMKGPEGEPCLVAYLGFQDLRTLEDKTPVVFAVSKSKRIEDYAIGDDAVRRIKQMKLSN